MKKTHLALLVALVIPTVAAGAPRDARACGMSVRLEPVPQKPSPVQEIARAEKALESGDQRQAVRAVVSTFPNVRAATAGKNALETRALRVFALALVRSGGAMDERRAGAGHAEWTPGANLAWAVEALREVDRSRPNDPTLQADLGEALAQLPGAKEEALKILGGLAGKDLMGSPHAYAALARLRSERGDHAGAEAAVKRCEEMTRTPGVCAPKPDAKVAAAAKA